MADKRWPKRVVKIKQAAYLLSSYKAMNTQLDLALEAFAEEHHALYERHKALREALSNVREWSEQVDMQGMIRGHANDALEADDAKD